MQQKAVLMCGLAAVLAVAEGARAQDPVLAEPDGAAPAAQEVVVSHFVPQTPHERWHGFWHENLLGTRPAIQIFGTAFVEHLGRQPGEWGLGGRGYAHRVENRIFSTLIDGTVHASLAAALHHETRYVPCVDPRAMGRVRHALRRTFFTYNQSGGRVLDVSGLAGIYAGTMLPMFWHPSRFRRRRACEPAISA